MEAEDSSTQEEEELTPEEAEVYKQMNMMQSRMMELSDKVITITNQLDCSDELKRSIYIASIGPIDSYVLKPNKFKESLKEFKKKIEELIEDKAIRKKLVNDVIKAICSEEDEKKLEE